MPPCPLVIALVPLKGSSRNLQFPHRSVKCLGALGLTLTASVYPIIAAACRGVLPSMLPIPRLAPELIRLCVRMSNLQTTDKYSGVCGVSKIHILFQSDSKSTKRKSHRAAEAQNVAIKSLKEHYRIGFY